MTSPKSMTRTRAAGTVASCVIPNGTRVHLLPEGSAETLCGLPGGQCPTGEAGSLPACSRCASTARLLAEAAAWNGPCKPGVIGLAADTAGHRRSVADCARCARPRLIRGRGLCQRCARAESDSGTIGEWGWTAQDRRQEYAGLRRSGYGIAAAAARCGVSRRTGDRYERALAASGSAPWRVGARVTPKAERNRAVPGEALREHYRRGEAA